MKMSDHWLAWGILGLYVVVLLVIDFFVLHRKDKMPSVRRAVWETVFFVANAMAFAGVLYWLYDAGHVDNPGHLSPDYAVIDYLTGYVIELSLSVDNLFVIAVIFTSFKIPGKYQHKLLFLGIMGALVFRGLLITVGIALVNRFHEIMIIFGVFLLYTAFKMLRHNNNDDKPPKRSWMQKLFNISNELDGGKFRTTINGKKVFTALFGALLTIEVTDVLFAFDSIPAIFSITTDPFIVFSSNIFAIMGLRSLYFFLANMLEKFIYLKYSVFAILVFVSIKLMTLDYLELPNWFSLFFISVSLIIGIWVSVTADAKKKTSGEPPVE